MALQLPEPGHKMSQYQRELLVDVIRDNTFATPTTVVNIADAVGAFIDSIIEGIEDNAQPTDTTYTMQGSYLVAHMPEGQVTHTKLRNLVWIHGSPRPMVPGAYWRPEVDLSQVWTLNRDHAWHYNLTGQYVSESEVPDGLTLLGALK